MKPEDLCKSGSEFGEQSALFCWASLAETRKRFPRMYRKPMPGEKLGRCKMYSINNNAGSVGGDDKEQRNRTNAIRGARAKQIGMQPGVADIFLPVPAGGCFGLYIELKIDPLHPENVKRKKKGEASPAQVSFGESVIDDGFGYCVCEGWESAKAVIVAYLNQ